MDLAQTAQDVGTVAAVVWVSFLEFLPRLAAAIVVLTVGYIIAGWAGRAVRRILVRAGHLDSTLVPVSAAAARYAVLIVVIVAALGQLGVQTTSILAALGAAGLAIGLALQGTLANIAAGLMLLWLRPFRAGDYIDNGTIAGTVREVGLFATQLDTFDGIYRFVPNSEIWDTPLFNYSRNLSRMTNMEIGISYEADIERARALMLDLARSDPRVLDNPEPVVFVDALGDSAVVLRYRVWIRNADYWPAQRYLLEEAKRRLDTAGIEIPFPQRVVHMANGAPPVVRAA
jgi:small conductance mechanosensitive channel